jgi:hypothetical protein
VCSLLVVACTARPYVKGCSAAGEVCVEGGVGITFYAGGPSYVDASTLAMTREVDPLLVDYTGGRTILPNVASFR